jgi:hypothetical protein
MMADKNDSFALLRGLMEQSFGRHIAPEWAMIRSELVQETPLTTPYNPQHHHKGTQWPTTAWGDSLLSLMCVRMDVCYWVVT